MTEINNLGLFIPMPKIAKIEVVRHLIMRVSWSGGIRTNRTDVVDLSPMINSLKHYRPLRNNEEFFRTAHLTEDGRILAWGDDDQIDMSADSIEELAEETMTAEDLRGFLVVYKLTHNEAAAQLGRSRRQIENYLSSTEPIPRVVVLACFGLAARKQLIRGSVTKICPAKVLVRVVGKASREPTETKPGSSSRRGIISKGTFTSILEPTA